MKPLTMFLAGISRPIPDITTFVTPIFAERTGATYMQLVDEGKVTGFGQVFIDEEFQPLPLRIPVKIGGAALYAFEVRNEEFLIGPGRELALLLDRWVSSDNANARYGRATQLAIQRFVSGTMQIDVSIKSNFTRVFFAWRSPAHQRWAMKRVNAKWVDTQRTTPPGDAINDTRGEPEKHSNEECSRHVGALAMGENDGPCESGTSSLHDICVSLGAHISDAIDAQTILLEHIRMSAGERVYSNGQRLDCLYVVHSGFLKTVVPGNNDTEEVLGFPMQGDILGASGIHSRQYESDAVALSDCEVAILPVKLLMASTRAHGHMEDFMYKIACRDLHQEARRNNLIALKCPEARLALFLFFLSKRFHAMGHQDNHFQLHMTHYDVASYLNLPAETVSETITAFKKRGLIKLYEGGGEIVTPGGLHTICQNASPADIFEGRPDKIDY